MMEQIRQKAEQLVKAQTGWSGFTLQDRTDRLADSGRTVVMVRAWRPEQPNLPGLTLWFDEQGEPLNFAKSARGATAPAAATRLASTLIDRDRLRERHPAAFPAARATGAITLTPHENFLTLQQGESFFETLTATIPASAARMVDVYFLVDTTGSMSDAVQNVKDNITSLLTGMALGGHDMAFGAGNYRDFVSPDPYQFQHDLAPTSDIAAAAAAISTWSIGNGGDGSEAQLYALDRLSSDPFIGWRPGAQRIVVWIGDYPGHDPVCAAINGLGYDITESTVIQSLLNAGIAVVAVSVGSGPGLDADPTADSVDYNGFCGIGGSPGQASRIVQNTGGQLLNGLDANTLADAILNQMGGAVFQLNSVQLVPSGGTAPFVAAVNPGAYGSLDPTQPYDLPFEVTFVGVYPCGPSDQVFHGALDLVVDGVVVAQKTVQITVPACVDGGGGTNCYQLGAQASASLLQIAQSKYVTVVSEGSACSGGLLPDPAFPCAEAPMPELRPCFILKWGDGSRDQLETEDFETLLLAVCNPYSNIAFGKVRVYNLRVVKADGSPAGNLPDGTPSVQLVPSRAITVCDVAPCSCDFAELAFQSAGAVEGGYRILFDYCVEDVRMTGMSGSGAFPVELWNS
jgi:hypothetical protein